MKGMLHVARAVHKRLQRLLRSTLTSDDADDVWEGEDDVVEQVASAVTRAVAPDSVHVPAAPAIAGGPAPRAASAPAHVGCVQSAKEWVCLDCTLLNRPTSRHCEACSVSTSKRVRVTLHQSHSSF